MDSGGGSVRRTGSRSGKVRLQYQSGAARAAAPMLPPELPPAEPPAWSSSVRSRQRRQGFCQNTKAVETPILDEYDQLRLWSHVQRGPSDQCWPWKAARSGFGYGRFKLNGKLYSPHRLIYAFARGPIPDVPQFHGAVVMHTCDNAGCCNPDHLKIGTQVDNVGDMYAKGRAHKNPPPRKAPSPLAYHKGVR